MPYNLKFYKTETATARCLAGTGPETSYTASAESIISQRDVDRKSTGWAKAAAQSMLVCSVPVSGGWLDVFPEESYETEGDKGGAYPVKVYTLTNTGREPLNWHALLGAAWLTSTPPSGFLYAGESVEVTVGVDDASLSDGATYTTTLDFVNVTDGSGGASFMAQVSVFLTPQVAASFESSSGTATLIGFSEYTSPSSPPKKYLTRTLSGSFARVSYLDAACTTVNCTTTSTYSGACTYDPNTGVLTTGGAYVNSGCISGSGPICTVGDPAPALGDTVVLTPTTRLLTNTLECMPFLGTSVRVLVPPTSQETLSNEDTEADAIARAPETPGSSNQAFREARGAGVFSLDFQTVVYTLDVSNLQAGLTYRVEVPLDTEDYGGGSSVVTSRTYDFTAAGPTHQIVDSVEAASGKQVTVGSPTVSHIS